MIKSFKNVCTKNSVWDAGDNEDVGKGSTKPEIEFEHALAVDLNACLVCSFECKATIERSAIYVCSRDGGDFIT